MTEFAFSAVSENLIGPGLVSVNKTRLNKSAIMIRSSLIEEW